MLIGLRLQSRETIERSFDVWRLDADSKRAGRQSAKALASRSLLEAGVCRLDEGRDRSQRRRASLPTIDVDPLCQATCCSAQNRTPYSVGRAYPEVPTVCQ
jgi:hypothetical protein